MPFFATLTHQIGPAALADREGQTGIVPHRQRTPVVEEGAEQIHGAPVITTWRPMGIGFVHTGHCP
jgi:hypothetical protein